MESRIRNRAEQAKPIDFEGSGMQHEVTSAVRSKIIRVIPDN